MSMNNKHKGAYSELLAAAWLLQQGYEVFRNVSAHGTLDIIAMKLDTKEIRYIDVKTASFTPFKRSDGSVILVGQSKWRANPGCELLFVYPDGLVTFEVPQTKLISPPTKPLHKNAKLKIGIAGGREAPAGASAPEAA